MYETIYEPVFLPVPPPLLLNVDDELLETLQITFFDQDFGSSELQKTQREVVLKMDTESMKGLVTANLETGKIYGKGKFDISKVTGIFISRDEDIPTIYFNEDISEDEIKREF